MKEKADKVKLLFNGNGKLTRTKRERGRDTKADGSRANKRTRTTPGNEAKSNTGRAAQDSDKINEGAKTTRAHETSEDRDQSTKRG